MRILIFYRNDASYNANTGPSCANDAIKVYTVKTKGLNIVNYYLYSLPDPDGE